ncbi:MAG TPA: phosphatidate cytidylyltransferase [Candidatus Dormibacteraeota bacterium]|jgi:phosphatidate cytidylyltransferase|nr:phosphatidate cytidylyltransferase [Candidatus Dormibacteraeota bacterium]
MTWKRVATAVVLIPGVVALIVKGSTAMVALALALVILLALFEFFALGDAIGHRAYKFWAATCTILIVYVQWLHVVLRQREPGEGVLYSGPIQFIFLSGLHIEDVFFFFLIGVGIITLWTKRPMVEALPAAGMSSSGLLFVALPLSYAIRIHGMGRVGPWILLFALVITWVGDTAAYFVGRAIGKHPLAPVLSPKKTWEGTIASLVGALLIGWWVSTRVNVPTPIFMGLAAAGNVAGQAGDLLESAFKRSAGVKDSGSILPGHGGMLDRIDALILVIPVVWYYWNWFCSPR